MTTRPSSSLAACRLAAGYTQETFAEKLRVERGTVGRWERGVQSPQPWQRPDLATALDITLDHVEHQRGQSPERTWGGDNARLRACAALWRVSCSNASR